AVSVLLQALGRSIGRHGHDVANVAAWNGKVMHYTGRCACRVRTKFSDLPNLTQQIVSVEFCRLPPFRASCITRLHLSREVFEIEWQSLKGIECRLEK